MRDLLKCRIHLLVLFVFLCHFAFSQKQANNWYFGTNIGLNFNQNPPQVLHYSKVNSIEGCASISDVNGNLLFYTNGISIVNKQHEMMVNGNNILGDLSSTNNTVIVPLPGSDSIYYLFTIGSTGQFSKGLRYNVINMKRQSGLGEVLEKNVFVDDEAYEKLAAVRHCNKNEVWITIRKWNTDQYFTYLLTPSGLNFSPIVSNTGLVVGGYENNALGTLKFSADGTKLVAIHSFRNDLVELMDFNNSTGQISNPVLFRPNESAIPSSYSGVYGAAFSPNGRLLYVSSNNDNTTAASVLYQFDISSMDSTAIVASKQVISQNGPFYGGALQAGPDGKIYYAMWRDTALSVIESPDNYGVGCNFQYNRILMSASGEPIQFGLPNFVSSDLDSMYLPYDFFRSGGSCSSLDVHFNMNKIIGADSVKWNFGDGVQSTLFSPTHIYSLGGSYEVSLTVFKNDCGATSETITHSIPVAFRLGAFLPGDTSFCKIVPFALGASVNANQYLWNTGQTSPAILVSQPGLYWLEIVNSGCSYRDSFKLDIKPSVSINLGPDVLVCINKPVSISAGSAPNSYLWNTGSTSNSISISLPGLYWATAINTSGCMASDTLKASWGDCAVYIPNAFSPNGDGQNETFGLINGMSSAIFSMYIYNRFGQVVFKSADSFARWDGKYKGKPVPQGNYPWMITYKNKEGFIQTDKGMVMLIR